MNEEKSKIENGEKDEEGKYLIENIENAEDNGEQTDIRISEEVVETIAGIAAVDTAGVAQMAGGFAGGLSEVFSGRKNYGKGIKTEIEGNNVIIDVNIIVTYGVRIPDVAFDIQNKVKNAVESMTGLKVDEVNVHVQGVDIPKNNPKDDSEKPEDQENN